MVAKSRFVHGNLMIAVCSRVIGILRDAISLSEQSIPFYMKFRTTRHRTTNGVPVSV
jgi:hypothetical protein